MKTRVTTESALVQENAELRVRLAESEETLRAIRTGEVDALVIGEQVYTLKGAETPYRTLIETINEGAATISPDGTVLYANRCLAEMLLMGQEDIIGKPMQRFLSTADLPSFETLLAQGLQDAAKGFFTLHGDDGTVVPVLLSFHTLESQEVSAVSVVVTNLTEQKKAEKEIRQLNAELEQRVRERTAQLTATNQELETFSYSVSHDLRAPLRAVDGFSRMMVEDYAERLDDEGRRMLKVICAETQRMSRLIDDLLTFSRLGSQQTEPEPIDMRELAQEVYDELVAEETPDRKLKLDLQSLPAVVGTKTMIRQVWVNLISNAIKFTKGREVSEIEITAQPGEDGVPVFRIKDNGAGFDMRYADKLFGVFQRLHDTEEFPGTGVGLALVQRIVRRHSGCIWGVGAVDQGATFYFTLPKSEADGAER